MQARRYVQECERLAMPAGRNSYISDSEIAASTFGLLAMTNTKGIINGEQLGTLTTTN